MTADIEEFTRNLKQENRERVKSLEGDSGDKYLLRFDVDGLSLQDVNRMRRDIRKNVPKKYNGKNVIILLDGVVNFALNETS